MSSTRDYTRAETSDTTTNVPLLSEDSWDDGHSDPVLMITDTVEDQPDVRFSVSSKNDGTRLGSPWKLQLTKTTVLVAIIALLIIICIVLSALLTRSGKSGSEPKHNEHNEVCVTEGCIDAAYHIFHSMNRSVDPCDNFYEFACGGWAQINPIPESKAFWGVYSVLEEENERIVRQLLTGASTKSESTKKAKTFYDSCMNMTAINRKGAKPLLDMIKKLGGWNVTQSWDQSKFDFDKTLQAVQRYSVSAFFSTDVDADDKDSSKNIIKIDQGGLTLSRIYYLKNMSDPILVAYLKYMTTIGVLLGGKENETRNQMRQVLDLEMKLAKIFVPHENRSQIDEIYNKTNIMKLQKFCDKIKWLDFFKNQFKDTPKTEIGEKEEVVVYATRYLAALSPVIKKASNTLLNNYMVWRVVASFAPSLSDDFRDAHEDLVKVLTGSKRSEDLWKRCMGETDGAIGMALGPLFIEKAFEGSSKQQATEMIDAIRASFKKGLPDLDWMDEKTRLAAEDKADAVVDMIGFPDYIKDPQKLKEKYDGLNFKSTEYFQNKRNSDDFHQMKILKRLREPVDKHKWYMTPPTVNAYYSPSRNQIVFPAGILQAPYYNKKFPKVVNFGGIGSVVGHELSHGFDNSGRMYDKYGNYGVMWWTNKSVEQYKTRSDCMVKQYSQFSYFNKHVNGKVTLGENIADNGGLKAAYNAYKEWEKKNGAETPLPLLNMTPDQTFFMAFAQNWCANIREELAIVMLHDDSHSPNRFRVLGSLSNLQAFAEAFKCRPGSKMNPTHKCHIW
ncbi:hypothetical protein ACROYT_G023554 [Oculina patagonica]